MKKALLTALILLSLPLGVEILARIKLSLETNNYRYLVYHSTGVKTLAEKSGSAKSEAFEPLLKVRNFIKREKPIGEKNVTIVGSSVTNAVLKTLRDRLSQMGIRHIESGVDGYQTKNIKYDDDSIIILEDMVMPTLTADFFNQRNKIKRVMGERFYDWFYNNSVFFLMLSEKLAGKINFSQNVVKEFFEETLPLFEKTFQHAHEKNVNLLFVIYPNYYLRGDQQAFGLHCGEVGKIIIPRIRDLCKKYNIACVDIYSSHNSEFSKNDFTDYIHPKGEGIEKICDFIVVGIKKYKMF